jgi:hypothetical protein
MIRTKATWGLLLAAWYGLQPVITSKSHAEEGRTSDMVPVAVLAGLDQPTIAKRLEKPSRCERGKYGQKCLYKDGAIEIVFIGGLADWFTVNPTNAAYVPSSISQLGLPADQKPTFASQDVMRWGKISGLLEVSAFPGSAGKASYFYVKARTP